MKKTLKNLMILITFISLINSHAQSDRRPDKSRLKITTFNVKFLWDGINPEEGQVEFDHKGDRQAASEHMEDIAAILQKIDADIVNLVEVENIEALTLFNNNFLQGMNYKPFLIKGKDSFTGQDVALLSRIDPVGDKIERTDIKGTSGRKTKSVSKNYFAKFEIDDLKLAVIGLHFLAHPSNVGRRSDRQAQADAIRQLAISFFKDEFNIVALGDYNDFDREVLDINNNAPISTVLRDIKEMNKSNDHDNLINVAKHIPKDRRFTAHWNKDNDGFVEPSELSSIDHILISQELEDKIVNVEFFHDLDPLSVSDHFPISVTLILDDNDSGSNAARSLRMKSILPNPVGGIEQEKKNEAITLINTSQTTIDLSGWKVVDAIGTSWDLSGTMDAGTEKRIKRKDQKMGMNNSGDLIKLIDPSGNVVQSFRYPKADEGVEIEIIE